MLKNLANFPSCLRFFALLSYRKTAKRNKKLEPLANPGAERCFCLSEAKGKNREAGPGGKIRQNFYRRASQMFPLRKNLKLGFMPGLIFVKC